MRAWIWTANMARSVVYGGSYSWWAVLSAVGVGGGARSLNF